MGSGEGAGADAAQAEPVLKDGGEIANAEQDNKIEQGPITNTEMDEGQQLGNREADAPFEEQQSQPPMMLDQAAWSNEGRSTGDDSGPQGARDWGGGNSAGAGGPRRRTPRQQEQNKHAQQRYRARRKAQFEELQESVAVLSAQVRTLEKEKAKRQALEVELAQLKSAGGAPANISEQRNNLPANLGHLVAEPAVEPASQPLHALIQALQAQGALAPPPPPPPPPVPPPPPASAATTNIPPAQIQRMVATFGQALWGFMSTHSLLQMQQAPSGLPSDVLLQITQMVKMGVELAGLVLHVSGPEAEALLHDGAPPGVPCAADDPNRWRAVAAAVALSPQQAAQVAVWRTSFLAQLDTCYTRRIALKSQALQAMEPADGASRQWAETLLLQAATHTGYALSAQADAELHFVAENLQRNVDESRAAVISALSDLLTSICSPAQAMRYLATSHPFSWNVLAFSQALASIQGEEGGPPGPQN